MIGGWPLASSRLFLSAAKLNAASNLKFSRSTIVVLSSASSPVLDTAPRFWKTVFPTPVDAGRFTLMSASFDFLLK